MKFHVLIPIALLASTPAPTAAPVPVSSAPAEWKGALERGDQAIGALQKTLFEKLQAGMAAGGAPGAINFCRDTAQAVSTEVQKQQGIALGRTSHRLRNPKNAPREWVKPLLASAEGKEVKDLQPLAVDLGDRIGMVKPMGVMPLCLSCHGAREQIPPKVQAVLDSAYPEDKAVGFSEGDFRGYIWAEIPK